MAEIIDFHPRQTELAFPPRPERRKRGKRDASPARPGPATPAIALPALSRRHLAPQTRRLEISPEAFAAAESGGPVRRGVEVYREGLLEAVLVLLATVGFGLAWVVVEQGRVELPPSGYDAPAVISSARSVIEGEQTWTNAIDVAARGSSKR